MNNKISYLMTCILACGVSTTSFANSSEGTEFKRFSVSAGWLKGMPQGKANPFVNLTPIDGTYQVGEVNLNTVTGVIAKNELGEQKKANLLSVVNSGRQINIVKGDVLSPGMSGDVTINSLDRFVSPDTGLEAESVNTLGLLFNYHVTDNWSLEIKAGLPPEVDIKGKGFIDAPLNGVATPVGRLTGGFLEQIANTQITGIGDIPLEANIPITSLTQSKYASSARAWLPAAEIHYQFGRSGVNKFRPYVGVGVIFAYFDKVKIDSGIEADLIQAGHMIQNILDDKAGASLERLSSSADPVVKVKTSTTLAPIATLGATFDFNQNWFAVGSVSYSKMNNTAEIYVNDKNTGKNLIRSSTKIDIDPLITYVGIGYRF